MNTTMINHKIACLLALFLVSCDCALKALGSEPQALFCESDIWWWWIPCAGWALVFFNMLFFKVTK